MLLLATKFLGFHSVFLSHIWCLKDSLRSPAQPQILSTMLVPWKEVVLLSAGYFNYFSLCQSHLVLHELISKPDSTSYIVYNDTALPLSRSLCTDSVLKGFAYLWKGWVIISNWNEVSAYLFFSWKSDSTKNLGFLFALKSKMNELKGNDKSASLSAGCIGFI